MTGFQKFNLLQKISLVVLLLSLLCFIAYGVFDLVVYAFEAVPAPKFDYGTLLSSMGVILCGLSILGIFVGHKFDERKAQDNCEEETVANLDAEESTNDDKNIEN